MRLALVIAFAAALLACGRNKSAGGRDGDAADAPDGAVEAMAPDAAAPEVSTTCVFPPRFSGDLRLASKAVLGDGLEARGVAIAPDGQVFMSGMAGRLRVGGRLVLDEGQQLAVVLAFNAQGAPLWQHVFPEGFVIGDLGRDPSGRLYVVVQNPYSPGEAAGASLPLGTSLVQLDAQGGLGWARVLPAPYGGPVAVAADGKVVVASSVTTGPQAHVTTFDAAGQQVADAVISAETISHVAWDGLGQVVVAGSDDRLNSSTGKLEGTGFVQALDQMGTSPWKHWFARRHSVTALAARGARVAAAGPFDESFTVDTLDAKAGGAGSLFVGALDQPTAGSVTATWLETHATGSGLNSGTQALALDARGGAVITDWASSFADLGTGALTAPGPYIARLDEKGHTTATVVLSDIALFRAVAVDAADRVVAVGYAFDTVDLGDGNPVPGGSIFVATYASMTAPAAVAPSCPALVDGALLDENHWPDAPTSLALDAERLFFTSTSEVAAVPLAGGRPQILASGQNLPGSLVLGGGTLHWTNTGTYGDPPRPLGEVMRLAPGAPSPTRLAADQSHPRRLAVDGASIYWAADGQLWTLAAATNTPARIATGFVVTNALAAAAGEVVFATDKHEIVRASSSPRGGDVVATAAGPVLGLAVDADTIYWFDTTGPLGEIPPLGDLRSVPLAGGATATLDAARPAPADLQLSGDRLYWSESWRPAPGPTELGGAVRWMPKTGGTRMTAAEGGHSIGPLIVGATSAAWVSRDKSGHWAVLTGPR